MCMARFKWSAMLIGLVGISMPAVAQAQRPGFPLEPPTFRRQGAGTPTASAPSENGGSKGEPAATIQPPENGAAVGGASATEAPILKADYPLITPSPGAPSGSAGGDPVIPLFFSNPSPSGAASDSPHGLEKTFLCPSCVRHIPMASTRCPLCSMHLAFTRNRDGSITFHPEGSTAFSRQVRGTLKFVIWIVLPFIACAVALIRKISWP